MERRCYSVGTYRPEEVGKIVAHARLKQISTITVEGPCETMLPDNTAKISVKEGTTAVILMTPDIKQVHHFWDGFDFPNT